MTTSCIVSFGSNALAISTDASIAMLNGGLQSFADLSALQLGSVPTLPYATFESNFWLLDGDYKLAPSTFAKGGWVSTSVSGSTGGFDFGSPKPELQIDFDVVHSTAGLYLTFSEHSGDYADTLRVVFYDAGLATIRDDTYNPTTTTFFTDQPITDFKRILIAIHSTNRASRYARVMKLDFDALTRFTGADIKAARVVEEINPLSIELPINTIELDLFSTSGDFSIVAPTGLFANLQYKQPLDVHEDVNGALIYIGRFYLDTWESKSANEATFEASDAIGLLDRFTHYGDWYDGSAGATDDSENLIANILTITGINYDLDASLTGIRLAGYLPIGNCRNALQQVCFAIGAYATCSRSDVIKIRPIELASGLTAYDYALTSTEKGVESPMILQPLITGTEVVAHDYDGDTKNAGQLLLGGSLPLGAYGKKFIFDSPVAEVQILPIGTEADITTFDANYMEVTILISPLSIKVVSSLGDIQEVHKVNNGSLPSGTPENVISISDATFVHALTTSTSAPNVDTIAQRVYDYYQQRYLQNTKLFGSLIAPGDSVLIDVQSARQMKGIVEKMETDLAGGYVSNVEIVGVII